MNTRAQSPEEVDDLNSRYAPPVGWRPAINQRITAAALQAWRSPRITLRSRHRASAEAAGVAGNFPVSRWGASAASQIRLRKATAGHAIPIAVLPRDDLTISNKFRRQRLRCFTCQPDHAARTFGNGTGRVCATHLSSHPAGTDGIDRKVRQGGGELDGDAVQRCLGDAVGGRPTVGAVGQLSAAAGNIDDPRIIALSQEGRKACERGAPERIGAQRRLKHFRAEREDVLVFIEENAGIVYQRVEAIALFRKFFRRMFDALGLGDIDPEKIDLLISWFPGSHLVFHCRFPRFLIARAEKHPKTFAGELARHFNPIPLFAPVTSAVLWFRRMHKIATCAFGIKAPK